MSILPGVDPLVTRVPDLEEDNPIALLTRRRLQGDQILLALVHLAKGCQVAVHQHESEQIAYVVSGKTKWTLGPELREAIVEGGSIVRLPSQFPHGVEALEDTTVVDILSPPGPMGVDGQGH